MALASSAAENAALNGLDGTGSTNTVGFVSLHTATPGTTGASEYSGVTRQACTWNAAASGAKTNSTALTFTTSGATPVTDIGTWSLVTAGVYSIGAHLGASVTAASITIATGAISLSAT
jgi:hypothetical protein